MSKRYLILGSMIFVACAKGSGTIDDTGVTATTDTGTTDTSTTTTTTDTSTTDTGTTTTDTGTTTTDTGTTTTDTGGWEPTADRYTLTPGAILSNSCGDAFEAPEPNDTATARFSWNGDKISIGFDREPAVECDWEFPGFPLCTIMEESEGQQGTTLTFSNSMEGEWSAPEEMSGTFNIAIDCTGSACDMFANQMNIAAFPCAGSLAYTGAL